MEVMHSIIYTTRYVFKNGNLDWYYFVAAFAIIYLIKDKRILTNLKPLITCFVLLLTMELGSLLFTDLLHPLRSPIIAISKLMLCFILLIFTKEYFDRINLEKFIYGIVIIQAIETIISLFVVTEIFWKLNDVENGFYETRLQLLYMEPSELCMCSAIALILLIIVVEEKGFKPMYVPCAAILLWDMYLSAGMGGILSLGIAIGLTALYKTIELVLKQKKFYLLLIPSMLFLGGWLTVYKSNLLMVQRIRLILSGEMYADSSTTWRLLIPLRGIIPILNESNWMGVGLGNFNEEHLIPFIEQTVNTRAWFPNSFLYFIAEGGWLAIAIIILGTLYLGYKTYFSKNVGVYLLFIFIFVYQIPGGYFTNPLNWICYGIILALTNKTPFKSSYALKEKGKIDSQSLLV